MKFWLLCAISWELNAEINCILFDFYFKTISHSSLPSAAEISPFNENESLSFTFPFAIKFIIAILLIRTLFYFDTHTCVNEPQFVSLRSFSQMINSTWPQRKYCSQKALAFLLKIFLQSNYAMFVRPAT